MLENRPFTCGGDARIAGDGCALIARARQGDMQAQALLLSHYRPRLRMLCGQRMPDFCLRREDASDVVQQTLVDASQGLADFRGETVEELEGWLVRLLERKVAETVRRHTSGKRDVRRELGGEIRDAKGGFVWHSLAGELTGPMRGAYRREAGLLLNLAIEQLPETQRRAVRLRFEEHLQLEEIAVRMATTKGAVAGLLRRGVDRLRQRLPVDIGERS